MMTEGGVLTVVRKRSSFCAERTSADSPAMNTWIVWPHLATPAPAREDDGEYVVAARQRLRLRTERLARIHPEDESRHR